MWICEDRQEENALLPQLDTHIPQRYAVVVDDNRAPRARTRDDDELFNPRHRRRLVSLCERDLAISVAAVPSDCLTCVSEPLVRQAECSERRRRCRHRRTVGEVETQVETRVDIGEDRVDLNRDLEKIQVCLRENRAVCTSR